jgi:hypothetical protein
MATSESAGTDTDVVHEVTVKLDEGPQPEAWAGLTPPSQVRVPKVLYGVKRGLLLPAMHTCMDPAAYVLPACATLACMLCSSSTIRDNLLDCSKKAAHM